MFIKRSINVEYAATKRRSYATKAAPRKVAIITGSTGQMGPILTKAGLLKGYDIVCCTRNAKGYQNSRHVTFAETPENQMTDPEFWSRLIRAHTKRGDELLFINTIGTAITKGISLEEANERPVIAAAQGVIDAEQKTGYQKHHFVHLSTIAATYLKDEHPYGKVKDRLDQNLLGMDKLDTSVLRLGFVFNDLIEGRTINMGHAYSPEQIVTLPIHPLLGSGDQIVQPVYAGDIVEAAYNMAHIGGSSLVNGVGNMTMTQYEFFNFFATLLDKKFNPISIPYKVAHYIAEHFPKGRIAPYSIALFEHLETQKKPLDHEPFSSLLSSPAKKLEDVYKTIEGEKLILARPPLKEHTLEIMTKLFNDKKARADLWGLFR